MATKKRLVKTHNGNANLDDLLGLFIDDKRSLNRPKETLVSYEQSIHRFTDYLTLCEMRVTTENLTDDIVRKYSSYLLCDEEDSVSPASVNHYLRELRAFTYWCQEKGCVQSFKVKLVKEPEVIKKTFSQYEQKQLTTKPKQVDSFVSWRIWAICNWILATGNRAKTVCSIQMQDICIKDKEIQLQTTKSKRVQIIPMSPTLRGVLSDYISLWRHSACPEDFLFCSIGDEELSVNALKLCFGKYATSFGIDITSIHALRHTFAKEWIRNGGNVFALQKMLGHSTLDVTKKYVAMFCDDLKIGFEQFNPLDQLNAANSRKQTVTRKS